MFSVPVPSVGWPDTLLCERVRPEAVLPTRATTGSVGYDLVACGEPMVIVQGGRAVIPTGWKIQVPQGTYGRIAPRSGLAVRLGLDIGAGVVDPDYRGEVGVVLFNHGQNTITITPGERIAQLVLEQVRIAPVEEVKTLDASARGEGGFGSTGVSNCLFSRQSL